MGGNGRAGARVRLIHGAQLAYVRGIVVESAFLCVANVTGGAR